MTDINNKNEQQVCNECGRHCPLDALHCDRGRKAAGLLDSDASSKGSHDAHEKRNERNEHDERREHNEHKEHNRRREHDECREHNGRREHLSHHFDLEATGDAGLYARLRQCGHYLFHSGKEQSRQKNVLALLAEHTDGITQRELTEILGIHRASVSELLGKLEKKEFIVRTADEKDRRQVQVALTEKGKNELPDGSSKEHGPSILFEVLTDEEKTSLYSILGKLIQAWGCSGRREN